MKNEKVYEKIIAQMEVLHCENVMLLRLLFATLYPNNKEAQEDLVQLWEKQWDVVKHDW